MCFGVMCVLEMRGGKKLGTIYVEFNRGKKDGLRILYNNPPGFHLLSSKGNTIARLYYSSNVHAPFLQSNTFPISKAS